MPEIDLNDFYLIKDSEHEMILEKKPRTFLEAFRIFFGLNQTELIYISQPTKIEEKK